MTAKEYINLTSTVPSKFVDELFEFYDEKTSQTDPVIRLDMVAKWLDANKNELIKTLKKSYRLKFDYIITKHNPVNKKDPRANNNKLYLLTPDCFKRVAMLSRSKNAEMVRTYFIEIENLYFKYRQQTLKGMQDEIERLERNQKPIEGVAEKELKSGYLYIIRASEQKDGLVKIGRTNNLVARLRNYNSGRADDVEVLYTYKVPDIITAERCIKALLKKYQYRKYKEVYQADVEMIKELLHDCNSISAKMHYKQQKMTMTGGFYIVVDAK
jgi:phage anti-repressor protein